MGLPELLLHVFSFLEARDMLCVARVDKVARPVPGGRQGWAPGHWRVHGRPVPSEPPFPKSGRERRTALNPRSAEDALGPWGGNLGTYEGVALKTSYPSVPPSVGVSRAPARLACTGHL